METDGTRESRVGVDGLAWVLAVRISDRSYEEFRDSGRLANLDISLAGDLTWIVTGDLGRDVMNHSTAESDSRRISFTRMILRMIYDL